MPDGAKTVETTETTTTKTVQTAGSPAPIPTTKNATPLGTSTMALRGVLNPNGVETKYWFEFSADPHFAAASTHVTAQRSTGGGIHEVSVEADVSALHPNTIYYFRLVAENHYGKVSGAANSFHTMYREHKPGPLGSALAFVTGALRPPLPGRSAGAPQPLPTRHEPKRYGRVSIIVNMLAIAGIIILIIIVLWGLIHLVSLSGGWFSSLAPAKTNSSIQVSAPAQIYSGDPFTVSWKYTPSVKGKYAFVYQCKAGLQFSVPTDGTFAQIPCGSAYPLGGATSSAVVFPLLSGMTSPAAGGASVSVPLTILYIPSATTTTAAPAQGSATVTVNPAKISQPAVQVLAPAPTQPANPVYKGPADLAVSIVSANTDAYGNATVSFDIANIGASASGVYYFTATLPTSQPYTYTSPAQASLQSGSHVVSTLNFTSAISGTFTVSISGGDDGNIGNNYASQYVNAPQYNQYQYNQPTYSPAPQPYYQPYYINNNQYPYMY